MSIDVAGRGRRFDDPGTPLRELGESGLLDALRGVAGVADDDADTWPPAPGHDLAVSIDALVEEVDFRRGWLTPWQLGRRAFAVAASDLAGTGALARRLVATVCARSDEPAENLVGIQEGLCESARAHGCAVAGGDVSAIDGPLVLDVCVIGEVMHDARLRRRDGQPGDILVVTGVLGRAAAGLRMLLDGQAPADDLERAWLRAQLEPVPRLTEGAAAAAAGIRCGGDISDGLAVDAARTARASGCAAELWLDTLPVDEALRTRYGQNWQQLAVGGGEDFELLMSVPPQLLESLRERWPHGCAPLTAVGRLVAGAGVRLLDTRDGADVPVPPALSRHFTGGKA